MNNKDQSTPDQYWASVTDHKDLLNHLDAKIKDYYDDLRNTGLLSIYERAYRAYYGGRVSTGVATSPLFESSRLVQSGKQGEKTRLKSNHYRNLVRHLYQISTQQKPDVQARASNSDYKSESQTVLANGLIDYYWREKHVSTVIKDAVEMGIAIYGEYFVHGPWDPNSGEVVTIDPSNNQPIYEGDQKYEGFSPLEVIRNSSLKSSKKMDWKIIKTQENRWDLTAEYKGSGLEEDILRASNYDESDGIVPVFQLRGGKNSPDPDILQLFIMYHERTDAMPNGRMVKFLKDVVLFDGPLPYKKAPLFRYCAEEIDDTIYGYTLAWDLLSIQEGIDELNTALMSNNKTFNMQAIWIKDTDKLQTSQLSGGMKLFKSEEPPTPIQLTKSAPETYDYLKILKEDQELLSGISSTVRGNPEANLKSGNALALVVSQAIQFASGIDEAVNRLTEYLGMGLVDNLRDFSKTERVANIVGEANRAYLETYNAPEDLSSISRVVVEQVNPLSKTVAGRSEMANNLLQQGMIKDPQEYLMVLETGRLDPVISRPRGQMLRIKSENEQLRKGGQVQAILTDNHDLDIREHSAVLDSPEARANPQLVQNVLAHIQDHINLARSMDPGLAMLLGQQPLPAPPPPPGMMPPQQGPGPMQGHPMPPHGMPHKPLGNPMNPQGNNLAMDAHQRPVSMPSLPKGSPPMAHEAYQQLQPPPGIRPAK